MIWRDRLNELIDGQAVENIQLANMLDVSGAAIGNMRRASEKLTSEHLFKLADFFGVEPRWLLYGTGPKHQDKDKYTKLEVLNGDSSIAIKRELSAGSLVGFVYEMDDFSPRIDRGDLLLIDTDQHRPQIGRTYLFKDRETDTYLVRRFVKDATTTGNYGLITETSETDLVPKEIIDERLAELECIGRVIKRLTDRV